MNSKRGYIRLCAGLVAALGAAGLLGWALNVGALKSAALGPATMKANTAVGFVLCGSVLWLLADPTAGRRRVGLTLAGITGLIGALTLAEYALDWNPGLDELLFRDTATAPAKFPGRMSLPTALCFVVISAGLVGLGLGTPRAGHPLAAGLAATLLACLTGLALFGYAADISMTYGWGPFTSMAMHTAAGFLVAAAGLAALAQGRRPEFPLGRCMVMAGALMMALILGLLVRAVLRSRADAASLASQSRDVQVRLGELQVDLADMQIGTYGGVITGREPLLKSHRRGTNTTTEQLTTLRRLLEDQPEQQHLLAELESAAARLTTWHRVLAETRRDAGFAAAQQLVFTGTGERLLADTQHLVTDLKRTEDDRLRVRELLVSRRQGETARLLTAASALTFLFIGVASWMVQRDLARRRRAEGSLHRLNSHLEERVAERTAKLNRTVESLNGEIVKRTRAEAALRENADHFRSVTETLPQLVWTCAQDGSCDYLGPQWVAYTGIPEAEQLGYGWSEQVHPEDRERATAAWTESATSGRPLDVEFRILRHDGVYRWFKTRAVPLRDHSGQILKWFGTNTDIEELRLAEGALRESESLARLATEATQVGIWKWNLRTNLVLWDSQMFQVYGIQPTAGGVVSYADWSQRVWPEDLPRQEALLQDTIRRRGQSTREFRIQRLSDGAMRIIQSVEVMRLDESAEGEWISGTNLDITERRLAEENLRASLREVGSLRSALNQHALVTITDPKGKITFVNDKFCATSQYTREELLRQDHRITNSGHHSKEFIRALWTAITDGQVWHGEIKNRAKDGSFYWVASTIVPFLDEHGQTSQYVAIRTDITARKKAEEEAHASQEALRLTLDAAEIGYWDLNLLTHAASRSLQHDRIFGYPELQPSWTYDQFLTHVQPEDRAQVDQLFQAGVASKSGWDFECRIVRRDGAPRWIWVHGNIFTNAAGEAVRVLGMVRDITARKEVEAEIRQLNVSLERRVAERTAELEHSNRDLEQFAYVASHDLQEPLRAVVGCVQIFKNRYQGQLDGRADELIAHTVDGATRMQTLIHGLLAYSRVDQAGHDLRPVEVANVLPAALANLRTAICDTGAVITHDTLPTVTGNAVQLSQLFQNLLGNALKYRAADRPPAIQVAVEPAGGGWKFSVRDNGIGIEPQYFERIFGLFQRLHTRRDYPGTGIGLALCKKIVERHGGQIGVESTPGQGSVFWFTLPGPGI